MKAKLWGLFVWIFMVSLLGFAQKEELGEIGAIYNAALSPDGGLLAVSRSGGIVVYSSPTLEAVGKVVEEGTPWALTFSPGGNLLACGTSTGAVVVVEIPDVVVKERFQATNGYIWGLSFSPDGLSLATSSWDGDVSVWDTRFWERTFIAHLEDKVWSVAFSPDGRSLAVGTSDGLVLFPLSARRQPIEEQVGEGIWSLSFVPRAGLVVAGGERGRVFLWDPAADTLRELPGHRAAVWDLAVSPDGKYLLSVSLDATARLWELPQGYPVAVLSHAAPLRLGAFSTDGFLTVSERGDVVHWNLGELLGLRPRITRVAYSSQVKVGRTQYVSVFFTDADANVSRAVLRLVQGRKTDISVSPGLDFPLGVYGRRRGSFLFSVALKTPTEVVLELYLVDARGLWSPPYELHLGPR